MNTAFVRTYYLLKPLVPRHWRMVARRVRARQLRESCADTWPILESAGARPEGWPGWPEGKDFAVVLTHDVEGQAGVDQVRQLAELEMECGFRSSFNFVPEGEYRVTPELRNWLTEADFEVGVHDLNHDGHLYNNRDEFRAKAQRINHYLDAWGAVGFRSAFMMRELEWMRDLDVLYDASTFDTDPFEPQPDGAGTIFPYRMAPDPVTGAKGYIELPYTLVQDVTLFLLLEENSPEVWLRKLDWIVEKGGMVLVNIHPDYVDFSGNAEAAPLRFRSEIIREFLETVSRKYAGRYWQPLPRELATWYDTHA